MYCDCEKMAQTEVHALYKPELKSPVWQYFKLSKEIKGKAFCGLCSDVLNYESGNTSSLKKHIERRHNISIKASLTATNINSNQSQLSIQDSFQLCKPLKINDERSQGIIRRIALMICKDLQPISILEDEGFKELVRYLEPRFKMVSRAYMSSTTLPQLYGEGKSKLELVIKDAEALSLTTDAWTSRATQNFVTVTMHCIFNWELKSYVLSTDGFSLTHTAGNLATHLNDIISKWKLPDEDCQYVTTDNASNITAGKYETVVILIITYV